LNISVKKLGTPANELLGPGVLYHGGNLADWANNPGTFFGTTKGGTSFSDNAEFRRRTADNDYMPVKGTTDLSFMLPQLTINTLETTSAILEKAFAGMASHTPGTFTAVETPLVDGETAADATSITIDGGDASETLLKGDLLVIGGNEYVVTADATASSGSITVSIAPGVISTISDDTAVVFPANTHTHLTRTYDLSSSYIDTVYWIGKTRGGKNIAIELKNVLGEGPVSWNPVKDEEIIINTILTAHANSEVFDIDNVGTYPYKIIIED